MPLFAQQLQMRLPFFVMLLRVIAELHTMRCYLDALVDLSTRSSPAASRPAHIASGLGVNSSETRGDPPIRGAASFSFLSGVFL